MPRKTREQPGAIKPCVVISRKNARRQCSQERGEQFMCFENLHVGIQQRRAITSRGPEYFFIYRPIAVGHGQQQLLTLEARRVSASIDGTCNSKRDFRDGSL